MGAEMSGPERDVIGYGANRPRTGFPDGKRLAISLVVNYEEGSERRSRWATADQETLTEWGQQSVPARHPQPRDGDDVRVRLPCGASGAFSTSSSATTSGARSSLARSPSRQAPDVARAAVAQGHEICSHGHRWEDVFRLSEDEEREHIRLAVESIERVCGRRPVGWYCRYGPSTRTRRLLVEEGGFLYDSDSYNDEVPYFTEVEGRRHWSVPYTPDANDIAVLARATAWPRPGSSRPT